MEIRNDKEYEEILALLLKGAEYIESPEFKAKPEEHKRAVLERCAKLSNAILKYKGLI